jgi:CubicO group peptidase (beta-lactamase class C family)
MSKIFTSLIGVCMVLGLPLGAWAADGEAVLDKVSIATGGLERYRQLEVVSLERTLTLLGKKGKPAISMSQKVVLPDLIRVTVKTDGGDRVLELSNAGVRAKGPGQAEYVEADIGDADWIRSFVWREWWFVLARRAWHGLGEVRIMAEDDVSENGKTYAVVRIAPRDLAPYRLFVDQETWLPYKRVFESNATTVEDVFSDYEKFDSLLLPTRIRSYSDGKLGEDIRYQNYVPKFVERPASAEARIEAIIKRTMDEKHIPGLSVTVIEKGKVRFEKSYGYSNLEARIEATPETVFSIASVSKILAGTAAMLMVEAGRLDLDKTPADYVEGLPAAAAKVTMRQLLSHTHGIEDYYRSKAFKTLPPEERAAMSRRQKLEWSLKRPFEFEPGQSWAYSLVGYALAQMVMEKIEGKVFEDIVGERIFAPLGLAQSSFGGTNRVVPGRHPVNYEWLGGELVNHVIDFPPNTFSAGGANMSVRDLAKLIIALRSGSYLAPRLRDEMWSSVGEGELEDPFYGIGWYAYETSRGRFQVGHEGGGSSWLVYYPKEDLAVIALSNMSGARADSLPYEIARAIFAAPQIR